MSKPTDEQRAAALMEVIAGGIVIGYHDKFQVSLRSVIISMLGKAGADTRAEATKAEREMCAEELSKLKSAISDHLDDEVVDICIAAIRKEPDSAALKEEAE